MKTLKTCAPPYVLSVLILFAHAGFRAAPAAAQTAAQASSPSRNLAGALGPRPRLKRVAPLRASSTPDGTRVTVTSDAPLSDYSAYRRGEDFYVRIPQAEADAARQAVSGRGLSSTRIDAVEGDLLLTFRLEPGTTARVSQNFNHLDVVFTPQGTTAQAPEAAQSDERLRQVLMRVEALEARVRELEAERAEAAGRAGEQSARAPAGAATAPLAAATAGAASEEASPNVAGVDVAGTGRAEGGHGADEHEAGVPKATPRMQIQGYADVNLLASNEKGRTTSFALGQIDLFVTSHLSENFSVLGELILEAQEDNSFSFTAHRLLLRYSPRDYFNLRVGRDHTAIGYYNTAYHHGSWFQTAANRPYLFAFENRGGPLPLHNLGVSVSGRIPSAPFGLRYVAEVGNGRSFRSRADSTASAVDENNGKAFNLALLARPPRLPGFQTGFSVYRDRLTLPGAVNVGETITAAHLVYRSSRTELLNEGVLIRHAAGARVFYTPGFYTQFARRFGDARPYFRYQYVNAPDDDPVLQPLEVGRRNGPSFGLRYDVSDYAAFKMQYDRTVRRRRSALDELILQLAFTF